jgi:hypothetical protein
MLYIDLYRSILSTNYASRIRRRVLREPLILSVVFSLS